MADLKAEKSHIIYVGTLEQLNNLPNSTLVKDRQVIALGSWLDYVQEKERQVRRTCR